MKKLAVIFMLLIALTGQAAADPKYVMEYWKEICTKDEASGKNIKSCYWTTQCYVYIADRMPAYLISELTKVISELNEMGVPIQLTSNPDLANLIVYYRSGPDYEAVEKQAVGRTEQTSGCGTTYTRGRQIGWATLYVNSTVGTPLLKCHTIREEITQSMGFPNDSMKYPDSIFYQGYSTTTEYSALDRMIIRHVYGSR